MIQDKEGRFAGEKSLGRSLGKAAGTRVWGRLSRGHGALSRSKKGEACAQRDVGGPADAALVRCGFLIASTLVKGEASHQLSLRTGMRWCKTGKAKV